MIGKLIKLQDLREGDEIVISSHSKLKYLKVLKQPKLGNTDLHARFVSDNYGFEWKVVGKAYKTVLCSTFQNEILFKYRDGRQGVRKEYKFEEDVSKHNKNVYINLNSRNILLIKRDEKL